jgi:hypothetical protein
MCHDNRLSAAPSSGDTRASASIETPIKNAATGNNSNLRREIAAW